MRRRSTLWRSCRRVILKFHCRHERGHLHPCRRIALEDRPHVRKDASVVKDLVVLGHELGRARGDNERRNPHKGLEPRGVRRSPVVGDVQVSGLADVLGEAVDPDPSSGSSVFRMRPLPADALNPPRRRSRDSGVGKLLERDLGLGRREHSGAGHVLIAEPVDRGESDAVPPGDGRGGIVRGRTSG